MTDFFQDIGITASPDSTVKIWGVESASCRQTIRVRDGSDDDGVLITCFRLTMEQSQESVFMLQETTFSVHLLIR